MSSLSWSRRREDVALASASPSPPSNGGEGQGEEAPLGPTAVSSVAPLPPPSPRSCLAGRGSRAGQQFIQQHAQATPLHDSSSVTRSSRKQPAHSRPLRCSSRRRNAASQLGLEAVPPSPTIPTRRVVDKKDFGLRTGFVWLGSEK